MCVRLYYAWMPMPWFPSRSLVETLAHARTSSLDLASPSVKRWELVIPPARSLSCSFSWTPPIYRRGRESLRCTRLIALRLCRTRNSGHISPDFHLDSPCLCFISMRARCRQLQLCRRIVNSGRAISWVARRKRSGQWVAVMTDARTCLQLQAYLLMSFVSVIGRRQNDLRGVGEASHGSVRVESFGHWPWSQSRALAAGLAIWR